MTIWKESLIEIVYYDVLPEEWKGEVKITSNSIVVSYKDENGIVIYKGKEQGKGHYVLTSSERNGNATLHTFKGSTILEGYLEDNFEGERNRGFWRVYLDT